MKRYLHLNIYYSCVSCQRDEAAMNEHLNPKSYSWCLMRYAIVRYVFHSLKTFLPKVGMELSGVQCIAA